MKILAFNILIFALRIAISRCQFSIISCAVSRSADFFWDQTITNNIYNIVDSDIPIQIENHVFFYTYSKYYPDGQPMFLNNTEDLNLRNFNISRDTKIITHGYFSSKDGSSCKLIRDAFVTDGNSNVIVVDWWPLQSLWGPIPNNYWKVASYVEDVGKYVAILIDYLVFHGIDIKQISLIGHSLGAHIMGIASYKASSKVNYIVGLDPALPLFENRNESERLSPDDANIVEVIHTDEGNCGMSLPVGHFDFYPNGGAKQPGCNSNKCSHTRSCELYAESILTKKGFYGHRCYNLDDAKKGNCFDDEMLMGGDMKSLDNIPGIYYLKTNDSYPFALGK